MPRPESLHTFPRYARWYVQHVLGNVSINQLVDAYNTVRAQEDADPPEGGRHAIQYGIDRITDLLDLPPRRNRRK